MPPKTIFLYLKGLRIRKKIKNTDLMVRHNMFLYQGQWEDLEKIAEVESKRRRTRISASHMAREGINTMIVRFKKWGVI